MAGTSPSASVQPDQGGAGRVRGRIQDQPSRPWRDRSLDRRGQFEADVLERATMTACRRESASPMLLPQYGAGMMTSRALAINAGVDLLAPPPTNFTQGDACSRK